jgi:hypothetical protein
MKKDKEFQGIKREGRVVRLSFQIGARRVGNENACDIRRVERNAVVSSKQAGRQVDVQYRQTDRQKPS